MQLYYLHFCDRQVRIADDEGHLFESLPEAIVEAERSVKELVEQARADRAPFADMRIEIADKDGSILATASASQIDGAARQQEASKFR